jgi:hypothetical protein
MNARELLPKLSEWIFRETALREARAKLRRGGAAASEAAVRQAKLLLEIAKRVEQPGEALPPGAPAPVLLGLYRDATYWALAARRDDPGSAPTDLGALWEASRPPVPDTWPPTEGDPVPVRRILVDNYAPRSLAGHEADVARVSAFARNLVREADAPRRRVERVLLQRWLRIALACAVLVLLALGGQALWRGPNLAKGKPFRLSSTWSGWDGCMATNDCFGLMFDTEAQDNPWVEIDLGKPIKVRRIEVLNRNDCCAENASPLVAEVSTDRAKWTQVARIDATFDNWEASFPPRIARYVRLRVARASSLHLRAIDIR